MQPQLVGDFTARVTGKDQAEQGQPCQHILKLVEPRSRTEASFSPGA